MSDGVQSMFARIAPRYDLANSVLSFGIHHYWRRRLLDFGGFEGGESVLDCATGTGDLALALERRVGPQGRVVAGDSCLEMLELARAKAAHRGSKIAFTEADVLSLPYQSGEFDAAAISFGIRNVSDPRRGLAEMARAVRPGGKVLVLEFGQPEGGIFGALYRFYSHVLLPRIGGWLTGEKDAYRYLQRTSASFPCGERFLSLMRETEAFSSVQGHALTGGIAYAYLGIVQRGGL